MLTIKTLLPLLGSPPPLKCRWNECDLDGPRSWQSDFMTSGLPKPREGSPRHPGPRHESGALREGCTAPWYPTPPQFSFLSLLTLGFELVFRLLLNYSLQNWYIKHKEKTFHNPIAQMKRLETFSFNHYVKEPVLNQEQHKGNLATHEDARARSFS